MANENESGSPGTGQNSAEAESAPAAPAEGGAGNGPATPGDTPGTVAGKTLAQADADKSSAANETQTGLLVRLRERFFLPAKVLENISSAAMLVFVLSSLSIMFILVVYTPTSVENIEVLRATQLLLTLAGTAVILALLTKDLNAFTVVFGFLIIAALIVPTRDVIRFALIASGSGKTYGDFFPETKDAKGQQDRTDDVAKNIYLGLQRFEAGRGEGSITINDDSDTQVAIVSEISKMLKTARNSDAYQRIAQKGAVETLKAIARDQKDEWVYRFGANEEFQSNLDYLRFEGAVSFDYGDLDLMKITPYGCQLLRNFDPPTSDGPYTGCPRSSSASFEVGDATYSVSLSLEADGLLLPFTVKTGSFYELCAVPETETADPKISLLGPDQTALASSDDYQMGQSAARVALPLEGGVDYVLDIQDYFGDLDSTVLVVIKKQEPALPAGKPCDGHLPERPQQTATEVPVAPTAAVPDAEGTPASAPAATPP